jgi:predicted nucleotide-binding protein (sugar kinase/HSP70/actin superfamily)
MKTVGQAIDATRYHFLSDDPNWKAASGEFLVKLAGGPARDLEDKLSREQIIEVVAELEKWEQKIADTPMQKRKRLFQTFKNSMYFFMVKLQAGE